MSSAFINSLGSFGSLTTTQTKSQSRTKKKTTQSGKIVVKKNMTAQGYLIRMANAKSPAQVAGIIRAARADASAMKNSDAGKTISYLLKSGLNKVMLGHLSKENNFPELAYKTVIEELMENNYDENNINISVASRVNPSAIINIENCDLARAKQL